MLIAKPLDKKLYLNSRIVGHFEFSFAFLSASQISPGFELADCPQRLGGRPDLW